VDPRSASNACTGHIKAWRARTDLGKVNIAEELLEGGVAANADGANLGRWHTAVQRYELDGLVNSGTPEVVTSTHTDRQGPGLPF
jgi:hypothetical protein